MHDRTIFERHHGGARLDILALVIATVASACLSIGGLGFHSDDWTILAQFGLTSDLGPYRQLVVAYTNHSGGRPVEALAWALLYWVFGSEPLGYHIVMASLLAAGAVLLYLVLRELRQPRLVAFSVPLLHMLAPNHSTVRFWCAASVAGLSLTLYFFSAYADLRAVTARVATLWVWKALAIIALLASTLAYEAALPLFLINPILAEYRIRRVPQAVQPPGWKTRWLLSGLTLVSVFGVLTFKVLASSRLGGTAGLLQYRWRVFLERAFRMDWVEGDYGLNVPAAFGIHYGDYGFRLPLIAWRLARTHADATVLLSAAVFALGVFLYLTRVSRQAEWPRRPCWHILVAAGVVVFGLGCAIFLTNDSFQLTPAGIGNRTAMAASVGVAISLVGVIGIVASGVGRTSLQHTLYCLLIAVMAGSGFLVNNTLGSFWKAAYREEELILDDLRERFPRFPPGTTLILDGICPYVGPAIVFESNWDLAGALQYRDRDLTLAADVATPRMRVTDEFLTTEIYDGPTQYYAYGPNLIVYDFERKNAEILHDAETARRYLAQSRPRFERRCPVGKEGIGVKLW